MIPVHITGTAKYLPKTRLTNADLEKMIDTSDEWITTRTGIKERRIVANGEATSAMATHAVRKLLGKTKTQPEEIDLIILATVTPDMFFPASACLVQNRIGAKNAWGFDLSGACSGFLFALISGAQFIKSGRHKKVVIIGADTMSSIVDPEDRNTIILFGDGAGAVLLEPGIDENFGILDFEHRIDGSGGDLLMMPAGGSLSPPSHTTVDNREHYVKQNGRAVYKHAVKSMANYTKLLLDRNHISAEKLTLFIPHQANARIMEAVASRIGLTEKQVMVTIDKYGNNTAATLPIAMDEAVDENRIKRGDTMILTAFGAGFTGGGVLIRWNK